MSKASRKVVSQIAGTITDLMEGGRTCLATTAARDPCGRCETRRGELLPRLRTRRMKRRNCCRPMQNEWSRASGGRCGGVRSQSAEEDKPTPSGKPSKAGEGKIPEQLARRTMASEVSLRTTVQQRLPKLPTNLSLTAGFLPREAPDTWSWSQAKYERIQRPSLAVVGSREFLLGSTGCRRQGEALRNKRIWWLNLTCSRSCLHK